MIKDKGKFNLIGKNLNTIICTDHPARKKAHLSTSIHQLLVVHRGKNDNPTSPYTQKNKQTVIHYNLAYNFISYLMNCLNLIYICNLIYIYAVIECTTVILNHVGDEPDLKLTKCLNLRFLYFIIYSIFC